ncbi:MAG: redox-regulated ATPase YchF [Actinobacteria bacterium]|nr:redox-regulated ATPase YchF [Actinomycetota bacterium]
MERLGLVGLPNAGKSAVFNALTGMDVPVAPHPFSTTETTVGIARVPDPRVERLAEMSHSKKVVHATVEVTDIAALVKGANTGEGLGNRFLGSLREADALVFVLRAFDDPNVPGESDPTEALATLELELVMADLESVTSRRERQRKAVKGDPALAGEVAALERAEAVLGDGTPLYRSGLSDDDRRLLAPAFLLTNKPALVVLNLGEDDVERATELAAKFGDDALAVCAQLEMEASRLDPDERAELLEGLGLGEGVVPRVAAAAYHLLGRRTFLTTGEDESRAWTFRAGASAPECAGVIHSDLQRGFIKAEVVGWEELLEIGSWAKAKEAGRLRVEGKEYVVQDGDVLEIRFNV